MCNILFNITQVKRVYIGVERLLIKVLLGIPYDGEEIIYDLTDLAVKVTKANLSSLNQNKDYIDIDAPLLFHKDCAPQTRIPAKILQNIPEEERKVAMVSYKSPDQFLFSEERPQSMLIRIELFEDRVRKLENPLLMKFQISNMFIDPAIHALECQFYDEWAEDASWSRQGCDTSVNERDVLCSCDHMTPFAVLLVPAGRIDSRTWKILSIISYIGSGLSVFFTAISIMTYIIIRNPSQDHSNTIHVSLSSALFLLNVSFLLNEWLASMNIMPLCLFAGVLMHYGLLCSFTWMAIEALHLYLLIIRVFNTYVRRYIAKLSLIGWGVPAVIVGITFAVKSEPNQFYGLETITVGNFTSSLCWITEPLYFYGLNISYFALIFLFNNGILLTVSLRICQMRHFGRKTRRMTMPWRQACTVLGLTCLLGSTWGLAFLSYGEGLSIPMQYLFCIFNSLQGFFIFLWIYGTSRKAKREVKTSRTVS
ncbi:hypothetical protein SKAU_G00099510 [Synaphobranchus kaupii]|uniref:Adhesion G-protein coupled receptor G5-like n=1 Tax=Synaphobranchus kaupii TaxID=118154 RepID=A0A9Q1FY37_SYNKA|nr:hypothetical protein SKAU_G00099510 [Synaphobranchus kaupii]